MSNGTSETKPAVAGTYYGELSPAGQWFWNGIGAPEDQWIVNPAPLEQSTSPPEVQSTIAYTVLKSWHLYIMGSADADNQTGYAGVTLGVLQTMNPCDVIKAFNITG